MAAAAAAPPPATSTAYQPPPAVARKYGPQSFNSQLLDICVEQMNKVLPLRSRPPQSKVPELDDFIYSAVHRSQATVVMVFVALIYADRMRRALPTRAIGDHDTPHRLFFVALMLASKFLNDQSYTNRAWSKVSSYLFRVDELNVMERDFLELIRFDLYVNQTTYRSFVIERVGGDKNLCAEFADVSGPFLSASLPPLHA